MTLFAATTFIWTEQKVLAAIDAGIAEVIRLHNRNVTSAWTHIAPRYSLNTRAGVVYSIAMQQTVATLNAAEGLSPMPRPLMKTASKAERAFIQTLFA